MPSDKPMITIWEHGVWVFKLDAHGNLLWQKAYESEDYPMDVKAYTIQETPDGGYVTAVRHGKVIKMDSRGNLVWEKNFWIEHTGTSVFHSMVLLWF